MNVLTVVRHPFGGIRTYLKTVYPPLADRGYRFRLLTVEESEVRIHRREAAERDLLDALDGDAFDHVRVSTRRPLASLAAAVATSLARRRFDVIHAHGFTAGAAAALGSAVLRIPIVLTLHETLSEAQFAWRRGRLRRSAMTHLYRSMTALQAVSDDARDNLLEHLPGIRANRVVVIRNGIDVDRFSPRGGEHRARWRGQLNVPPEVALFGFLGRLMPEKGYQYLVDAVELLARDAATSYRFAVLVVSDGCFIRELQSDLRRRGLIEHFHFIGLLPDVADVLPAIDAVVMPSLREAGPLVPMEVLASGCPLIATTCIGLREVIARTPALAVPTGNAGALAAAMRRAIERRVELEDEAIRFAPLARQRFDGRHTADALDALFRQSTCAGLVSRARNCANPSPSISRDR